MTEININQRIRDETSDIDDENIRKFIEESIEFERSKMDKSQPHFRDEYNHLVEEYSEEYVEEAVDEVEEDDTE